MRARLYMLPLAAALICGALPLAAQGEERGSQNPPQTQPLPPENPQQAPSGPNAQSGSSGSLSNDLSRSGGVLQPPPTGDRGVVSPPAHGAAKTPVIPPPGTPGGNPQVQPK